MSMDQGLQVESAIRDLLPSVSRYPFHYPRPAKKLSFWLALWSNHLAQAGVGTGECAELELVMIEATAVTPLVCSGTVFRIL